MFNYKIHKFSECTECTTPTSSISFIKSELAACGVVKSSSGYSVIIGDEKTDFDTLAETKQAITHGISELKRLMWKQWEELAHTSIIIANSNSKNEVSMSNIIFLSSAKKAYLLSGLFSQLKGIRKSIKNLFMVDISTVPLELIKKFNTLYLRIRLVHYMTLYEVYRLKLIGRYMKITKAAQVSGPWSNLDLPMKERVWEWDDEEQEYFDNREKSIKDQVRYNPETDKYGFYYVWQDLTRDPYKFEDMEENSPYKSRHLLTQP